MILTGQRRMLCNVHRLFLVKQPLNCTFTCCVKNCSRKASWSCIGRDMPCLSSVCFGHARGEMDLLPDNNSQRLRDTGRARDYSSYAKEGKWRRADRDRADRDFLTFILCLRKICAFFSKTVQAE